MNELRDLAVRSGQSVDEDAVAAKPKVWGPKVLKRMKLASEPDSEASKLAAPSPAPAIEHVSDPSRSISYPASRDRDTASPAPRCARDSRSGLLEHRADLQRGEPPKPSCDWLLDMDVVPNLLMVWEACMVSLRSYAIKHKCLANLTTLSLKLCH